MTGIAFCTPSEVLFNNGITSDTRDMIFSYVFWTPETPAFEESESKLNNEVVTRTSQS